jgi:hypothetical protein
MQANLKFALSWGNWQIPKCNYQCQTQTPKLKPQIQSSKPKQSKLQLQNSKFKKIQNPKSKSKSKIQHPKSIILCKSKATRKENGERRLLIASRLVDGVQLA